MKCEIAVVAPMERRCLPWALPLLLLFVEVMTVDAVSVVKLPVQHPGVSGLSALHADRHGRGSVAPEQPASGVEVKGATVVSDGQPSGETGAAAITQGSPAMAGEPSGKVEAAKEGHETESEGGEAPGEKHLEVAYAYCLMGGVAVIMSLFYLVNSHRKTVVASSWAALNMTVSIFCAVLIFGMMQEITRRAPKADIPLGHFVKIFIFTYLAMHLTLALCMKVQKGAGLKAAGTLFSHLAGFAATFLGAEVQFLPQIRHSVLLTFLVALATGAVLVTLNFIASLVRQKVVEADGRIDEEEELWQDVVADSEKDALSLAMGFTLMQSFRFAVTGKPQEFEPDAAPEEITQWDVDGLLLTSGVFAALVVLGVWLSRKYGERTTKGSLGRFALDALPSVASMGMAWSLLFWGEWQIYTFGFEGVRIAGCLLVALVMTCVGVLLIFGLDFLRSPQGDALNDQAIGELVLATGLLVGFTWERCFDMGLDGLSEMHGSLAWITRHALPLLLVVMVLPAWSKYILPKAAD